MKKKTHELLLIMQVLTWIIYIGLCIKTGALLISFFVGEFINPEAANNLHLGLNLFNLRQFSTTHYFIMVLLVIALWALKAGMFYLVIKIFSKLNLIQPFSNQVATLIRRISYVALSIGIVAVIATEYSKWLVKQGISINALPEYVSGAEFLFFAGIIFIIALVFKKGIEIQTENELTI
jgi:hypothetical protein